MASSFTSLSFHMITSIIFILTFSLASPSNGATGTHDKRPFGKMYGFGDSLTDTGNTDSSKGQSVPAIFTYVSNPPYGSTFFHHPTNRYSDGRLVIDFVAQALSLPYLPPYRNKKADKSHGVNFAVAGSTAISYDFFVKNNLTLDRTLESLQTQLTWFNKFLKDQEGCTGPTTTPECCKSAFDDALIWVGEIGANDYAYSLGSSVSATTIQQLAIKSLTRFLQALLSKGAKYIVVQGLPTIGCIPTAMILASEGNKDDIGCLASFNKQSYSHNTILQSKLQDLRTLFPNAVIIYADYYNAYRAVMKNPTEYGFKELFKVCCGSGGGPYNFDLLAVCGSPSSTACPNPSQYINWDGAHLTEAMYKVVSDSFLNGTTSHPPFHYLLSKKQQSAGMN